MRSTTYLALSLALIGALSAPGARADLITFAFEGHITSTFNVGFLGGSVPVGTLFSGEYTFDSTTLDTVPQSPQYGQYQNALTAFTLQLGPHLLTRTGIANQIQVWDGIEGSDLYYVQDLTPRLVNRNAGVSIYFDDYDATVFKMDELPVTPPSLTAFEDRTLAISDGAASYGLLGQVTSLTLVPEPTTLALLGVGILVINVRRRK